MATMTDHDSKLLLFGDQTDSFYATIKQIYQQPSTSPWLRSFPQDVTSILRTETREFDYKIRNSLGGPFTDLLQLAERFRDQEDQYGLAHTLLVSVARAGVLLQYVWSCI